MDQLLAFLEPAWSSDRQCFYSIGLFHNVAVSPDLLNHVIIINRKEDLNCNELDLSCENLVCFCSVEVMHTNPPTHLSFCSSSSKPW